MDEVKRSICNALSVMGMGAFLINLLLIIIGNTNYLLVLRTIFSAIALINFAGRTTLSSQKEPFKKVPFYMKRICRYYLSTYYLDKKIAYDIIFSYWE